MYFSKKMKSLLTLLFIFSTLMLTGATSPEQQMIVVFKKNMSITDKNQVAQSIGITWDGDLTLINGCIVHIKGNKLEALKKNPNVQAVYEDVGVQILGKPVKPATNQPVEVLPWGVSAIHANMNIYDGTGIKVGILDTGIDSKHPDLIGKVIGGKNFIGSNKSYQDDNGHGTHVAGTVAAIDNEIGVIGVSPNVQLYALKALDSEGNGNVSDIIEALQWAVENKIDVVNMSIGTTVDNLAFKLAVENAAKAGLFMVAAAGNDGSDVNYPAAYNSVIAVSAVDPNLQVAFFSSHGVQIDISAPGVDVISTIPGGKYAYYSGTSMAAPHVTGVLAQILQAQSSTNTCLSYNEILQIISDGARYLGDRNYYGSGLINAFDGSN